MVVQLFRQLRAFFNDSLCFFPLGAQVTDYVVPSNTKEIGDGAFMGSFIETIKSNTELEAIGRNAFYNSIFLKHIKIPTKIASIKEGTFAYCFSLMDVEVQDELTKIEKIAFLECESLETVIMKGVICIGEKSFYKCNS